MNNLSILPILPFLLLPNNGTVFHLTNIINSVNTKDVIIFNIEKNNQRIYDILDDTLRYIRKNVAVTVLDSIQNHQNLMNERSTAVNIVLFDNFHKVYTIYNLYILRLQIIHCFCFFFYYNTGDEWNSI